MRSNTQYRLMLISLLWLLVLALRPTLALAQGLDKPSIEILETPPRGKGPDPMQKIRGRVRGVEFDKYYVLILTYAGGTFYPQPFVYKQLTEINSNGYFEEEIHLGDRYYCLLVGKDFPAQPPEFVKLPETGVLAMDFASPGSGLIATVKEIMTLVSSSLSTVLGWALKAVLYFVGLLLIVTLLIIIAAIPAVVAKQSGAYVSAVVACVRGIVNTTENLINHVVKTIAGWMGEEQRSKPSLTIIGLVGGLIAPVAAWADYKIIYYSMELLIQSGEAMALVAVLLVVLKALAGLLWHAFESKKGKALLFVVLAASLACEIGFAFQRTLEVEKAAKRGEIQSRTETKSASDTGVIVNTAALSGKRDDAVAMPADPAAEAGKKAGAQKEEELPTWTFSSIMMALIALVCGAIEILGFWSAIAYAGKMIGWLFFAPIYLPAKFLAWALSPVTNDRLVDWINVGLRAALDLPDRYQSRMREWRMKKAQEEAEDRLALCIRENRVEEEETELLLARLGRADAKSAEESRILYEAIRQYQLRSHQLAEQKKALDHLAILNDVWREKSESLLSAVFAKMKEQFSPVYEQMAAEMTAETKQKVREKYPPVVEKIADTYLKMTDKQVNLMSNIDGYVAPDDIRKETARRDNSSTSRNSGTATQTSNREEVK